MRYEIVLAPEAATAYRALSPYWRAIVRDALERHLRHEPTKVSKTRIKRLRGLIRPQYRLRVAEIRVFYEVTPKAVQVLTIVPKEQAEAWLRREGTPTEEGGLGQGEG